jgi:hypothetical protein
MKHSWNQIETQQGDIETHQCTKCDLIRSKVYYGGPWPDLTYYRNGQAYGFKMPMCYDDSQDFTHAMGEFK